MNFKYVNQEFVYSLTFGQFELQEYCGDIQLTMGS